MNKMTYEELREIFVLLKDNKLNPQLCDTPVPYFDACVKAGIPTEPGDYIRGECLMLPHELVKSNVSFTINVSGDSMKDENILDGDKVKVQAGLPVRDGDIIIASINNECTLKAYYEDNKNNKWLVPRNEMYEPIRLTEEMDIRIIGTVTSIIKDNPRVAYSELVNTIKRKQCDTPEKKKVISKERVEEVICKMGDVVKQVRQWYAVFRAMVDAEVLRENEYEQFVAKVLTLLPMHQHLPVAPELRRMAVQSFRKPVSKWSSHDAPVSGYRFEAYQRIANLTLEELEA